MVRDFKKMTKDELKAVLNSPELAVMTIAELTRLRKAAQDAGIDDPVLKDNLSIASNNRTCEDIQNSDKYTAHEKKLAKNYRDEYNNEIKLAAVKRKARMDGGKFVFADLTKGEMDLLMASGVSMNDIVLENAEKKEKIAGIVGALKDNAAKREAALSAETDKKARLEEEKNKYRAGLINVNQNGGADGKTFVATPEMFHAAENEQKKDGKTVVAPVVLNNQGAEKEKNNKGRTAVGVVPVNGGSGNGGNSASASAQPAKKEGFWKRTWDKLKKPLLYITIAAATLFGVKQCNDKQKEDMKKDLIETVDGRIKTLIPCDPCEGLDMVNARVDSLEQRVEDGRCKCNEKKAPVRKKTPVKRQVKKADPIILPGDTIKGDPIYVPGDTIKGEPVIIPGDTIKGEPVYVPGDTVRGKKRIAINLEQSHKAHNEYEEAASENKGKVAATRKKIEENKQKILQAAGEEKGPGVVVERVAVNLNSEKKKGKGKTAQVAAADFYMALNNLGRSE